MKEDNKTSGNTLPKNTELNNNTDRKINNNSEMIKDNLETRFESNRTGNKNRTEHRKLKVGDVVWCVMPHKTNMKSKPFIIIRDNWINENQYRAILLTASPSEYIYTIEIDKESQKLMKLDRLTRIEVASEHTLIASEITYRGGKCPKFILDKIEILRKEVNKKFDK